MVFWLVALWLGVWGAGFVQLQGKAKVAGVLMLMKIPTSIVGVWVLYFSHFVLTAATATTSRGPYP
jgi:hypothetical protein